MAVPRRSKFELSEVQEMLAEITKIAGDCEGAHVKEDNLWLEVLMFIANEKPDASVCQALAAEAVKTLEIEFDRWYA